VLVYAATTSSLSTVLKGLHGGTKVTILDISAPRLGLVPLGGESGETGIDLEKIFLNIYISIHLFMD
jgi:hypothetical protein